MKNVFAVYPRINFAVTAFGVGVDFHPFRNMIPRAWHKLHIFPILENPFKLCKNIVVILEKKSNMREEGFIFFA